MQSGWAHTWKSRSTRGYPILQSALSAPKVYGSAGEAPAACRVRVAGSRCSLGAIHDHMQGFSNFHKRKSHGSEIHVASQRKECTLARPSEYGETPHVSNMICPQSRSVRPNPKLGGCIPRQMPGRPFVPAPPKPSGVEAMEYPTATPSS